jgi:hypothetical protein
MSCTLNVASKPSFLPLRDAVLCKDCQFISADAGAACAVCGSRSLLRLSELVRASAGPASVNGRDIFRFPGWSLGGTA